MTEVQFFGWVVVIGGFIVTTLLGLVTWFARHNYAALEKSLAEERSERQAVAARLASFQLEVARDCINANRLKDALQPLSDQMEDIKRDVHDLFNKKQDKA